MGKAARRKHAEEQQRVYFDIKGDARSAADRAHARVMLDALQQKLVDDALREDGFYFVDGKYVDVRRPRFTPGMKTQTFAGHTRRITQVAVVSMKATDARPQDLNSLVVTFGTDGICVWIMKTGEHVGTLDVASHCAVSVCGAVIRPAIDSLLWIGYATHLQPQLVLFDFNTLQFKSQDGLKPTWDVGVGHQQQITCMAFSHGDEPLLATGSLDSTCIIWNVTLNDHQPQLTMLMILPVADVGVAGCALTHDNHAVVSIGSEGTVKVWCIEGDMKSQHVHQQHADWQRALPLTLSVPHTRNLLLFDDSLMGFHGHSEWLLHGQRNYLRKTDILQAPATVESHDATEQLKIPPPSELLSGSVDKQSIDDVAHAVEQLRREYETMESFDFEKMLNPAAPVMFASGDVTNRLKTLQYPVLTPDGNGRLLRTFSGRKENGEYAAHTSHVADVAVATEVDLVVTVSFDKSVICWSLEKGIVRSITREAHAAPITSCALTSSTTSDLEFLLATAGKDNLVKVWRFNTLETGRLECIYSLAGHYDAITSLAFDASGVFLVSASDDTLAHCWRVRPAPPDAPTIPTILTVDRFEISMEWNVPLANGSALLKYVVHTEQLSSLTNDGSDIKSIKDQDVDIKYTTITVVNLQPGIQYRLCVAAVNSVGQSQWSETTNVVETLAFAPSKIDKAVLHRDVTATSVRLSWRAPCSNGATITRYTVQSRPENTMFVPTMETHVPVSDLSILTAEPDGSRRRPVSKLKMKVQKPAANNRVFDRPIVYEYVLDGLWPGEVYQFIVAAENRCGLSPYSPYSDYVKMDSTAPDAPAKPQLTSIDKRHAEVTWIKPRNNGSEVLQYIIEWTQESEPRQGDGVTTPRSSVTILTKSIVGTAYKIGGLRPGRPLRVWVAATNLVNGKLTVSPFSEPSDIVSTLCDVPDLPSEPRIESPSPHSIVIAIDPPVDNGARIELYQITLYYEELQFGIATRKVVREILLAPDDFGPREKDGTDRWLRYTAFKLRAKAFYSATVMARNALGWSKVSEASKAVSTKPPIVPATVSFPPQIRDVEPTQATISWTRPDHDGGVALASLMLQYSLNAGAFEHEIVLFEGTELVLEQLKPRTTYRFRVAATNAVGRAAFSPASAPFTTPSLVDYTIATYFASRPPSEHAKATVLQRRYRLWKHRAYERRVFLEQLTKVLASSWHIL